MYVQICTFLTTNTKTTAGCRIHTAHSLKTSESYFWTAEQERGTDGTYESVVVSASDYYPFGMAMAERTYQNSEYRYGFNGKENDTDFGSHIQDYGFRLYSPAEVRFLSVDPLTKGYPMFTPYQFASNSPIGMIDVDGLEGVESVTQKTVTMPKPDTAPKIVKQVYENHSYTLGEVITKDGVDYQVTNVKPDAKTFYFFRGSDNRGHRLIDPSLQVDKIHSRVSLGDLDIRDHNTLHTFAGSLITRPTSTTEVIYDLQVYGVKYDEVEFTELQPVIEATEIGTTSLEEISAGDIQFESASSNLSKSSKDNLKIITAKVGSNQELHIQGTSAMGIGIKPSDLTLDEITTFEELASQRATVAQNYIQITLGRADIKIKKSSDAIPTSSGGKRTSSFTIYNVHKNTRIANPRKTERYHNLKTVEELQKQD